MEVNVMRYLSERIRLNGNIFLLAAVIFFLTPSCLPALAQSVDETTLNLGVPANDSFNSPEALGIVTTGAVSGNNVSATKEPGEPNHAGNMGGHSVWYS